MRAVEPGRADGCDEELTAVRIAARVGHADHARARVAQAEVLVFEGTAVDAESSGAVAALEVPTWREWDSDVFL